jgi:hypothetical protein
MVEPISLTVGFVSAIAACVSAFGAGSNLFQDWRRKKARRQQRCHQSEELGRALIHFPTIVQQDFDHLSSALGPRFARGDRTINPLLS